MAAPTSAACNFELISPPPIIVDIAVKQEGVSNGVINIQTTPNLIALFEVQKDFVLPHVLAVNGQCSLVADLNGDGVLDLNTATLSWPQLANQSCVTAFTTACTVNPITPSWSIGIITSEDGPIDALLVVLYHCQVAAM